MNFTATEGAVGADFADQPANGNGANFHGAAIGNLPLTARELERMDLRCRCLALHRRASIAQIKMEYGLLTADEQDDLVLEGKELLAEIDLWRKYR